MNAAHCLPSLVSFSSLCSWCDCGVSVCVCCSQHSWLNPSMSLSKLRRCKALLLSCGLELDLELSTVALACVYVERLCWRNVLEKKNRKLASAVCLALAFKWNEAVQHNVKHRQLNQLFAVRRQHNSAHSLSYADSSLTH